MIDKWKTKAQSPVYRKKVVQSVNLNTTYCKVIEIGEIAAIFAYHHLFLRHRKNCKKYIYAINTEVLYAIYTRHLSKLTINKPEYFRYGYDAYIAYTHLHK